MTDERPVILLTGFGPFPGMPANLTGQLVPPWAARAAERWPDWTVVSEIFATEWDAAPQKLTELYAALRPQVALHFGVAERASGFEIETMAVNCCAPSLDAAGLLPSSSLVDAGGCGTLSTRLPADTIVARLATLRIPVGLSTDAGQYLCNSVFYRALGLAADSPMLCGFIHIPARLSDPSQHTEGIRRFDWETALEGGLAIVATCVEASESTAATS